MSKITKIINFFIFKKNRVMVSKFSICGIIVVKNRGTMIIGDNFRVNSGSKHNPIGGDTLTRLITTEGAKLLIGDNVGISNSTIYCMNQISIGNNVRFGGGCKVWDTDFHSIDPNIRSSGHEKRSDIKTEPVVIKENVFIGALSIILKGVTIGNNSVIGAGSIICKDVPDNEIWAGNPARFIRKIYVNERQ